MMKGFNPNVKNEQTILAEYKFVAKHTLLSNVQPWPIGINDLKSYFWAFCHFFLNLFYI